MKDNHPPIAVVTEPVYQQLARICRTQLRDGNYRPGDTFPSERELAAQYRVSRATANKVVSNMVAEGLLSFRPGLGTIVRESAGRLSASLREMKSFTRQARAMGWTPKTEVLSFTRTPASRVDFAIAEALGLGDQPAAEIVHVKRLRKADGLPAILEDRWLRSDLVPRLTQRDVGASLYDALETRHGIIPSREQLRIRARSLSPEEADLLLEVPGAPVLEVAGVGLLSGGRPLWYQTLLYRADRYELLNVLENSARGCQSDVSLLPRAQPAKKGNR